ncbi:MAG: DHH family phosphoesterase [Patescibacteria group bacterium]
MPTSLPIDEFDKAKQLMLGAQRILIISHKNPDADSIGANLALREALENMGKTVTSTSIDPIPESCLFLRKAETYVRSFNLVDFDLVITVDCGSHKLMAFHETMPDLLDRQKIQLINIDHHPSNDNFGNVNIVMAQTPATCFMLFVLFSYYGWSITPTMATSLLQGLYYDTGSFMHSNTSADSLRIAARLKALGADLERSVKEQFHTASIPKLRLWGRALSRATLNEKQAVVTAVTEQDYKEENATPEDLSGLVNYLNHVPEAKFCMLLTEDFKGNIKGSLRTQNETMDLTALTGLFGGGGHKKAAGFTVPGHLVEKKSWDIV